MHPHLFTGLVIVAQLFVNTCLCFSFQSEVTDKLRFTTFYFYFGLVVCELILCCFNEKPPLFSNVDTDPVSKILSVVWLSKFVCVCTLTCLYVTHTEQRLYKLQYAPFRHLTSTACLSACCWFLLRIPVLNPQQVFSLLLHFGGSQGGFTQLSATVLGRICTICNMYYMYFIC